MSLLKIEAYVSVILIRGKMRGVKTGRGVESKCSPSTRDTVSSRFTGRSFPHSTLRGAGTTTAPRKQRPLCWNLFPTPVSRRCAHQFTRGTALMPHACTRPQRKAPPDAYLHTWHTHNSRVHTGCTRGLGVPSHALTLLEMKISCLTTFLNAHPPAAVPRLWEAPEESRGP